MINPEAREARAWLEACNRARPGDDIDAIAREITARKMAETGGEEDEIDDLVWNAPKMTPPQLARIKRSALAGQDYQAEAS